MHLRDQTLLACVVAAVLAAGCGARAGHSGDDLPRGVERVWYEDLAPVAAARLGCPRADLDYRYLGDRVHLVRGCGGQVRYLIFQRGDLWVKVESFHERAAFELECSVARLSIQRLDNDSWRVFGCGRQAGYALECQDDGTGCDWLTNEPVR